MSDNDTDSCPETDGQEMGYQYLDSRFTGNQQPALSGMEDFYFPWVDAGTAGTLEDMEL